MASITFFCCLEELVELFADSSSFCLTSSGRLPPGRFFIRPARPSFWALRVSSSIAEDVDDLFLGFRS